MKPDSAAYKKALKTYLEDFLTPNRVNRFNEVASNRTRYITVVLENIYQPHNASAVLRSCDCFGIQDVHIIEDVNPYHINEEIALGSSQWLNLFRYNGNPLKTEDCLSSLKNKGYKIAATTPHSNNYLISNVPLDKPLALVFGTEADGITSVVNTMADYFVKIPMLGFTESLNISVSAAISLYQLRMRLGMENIAWELPSEEQLDIIIDWMKKSLKNPDALEKNFREKMK